MFPSYLTPIYLQIAHVHFHAHCNLCKWWLELLFQSNLSTWELRSYLTSHIYFMLFLSLSCVAPPHTTVRESLFPHWFIARIYFFSISYIFNISSCVQESLFPHWLLSSIFISK